MAHTFVQSFDLDPRHINGLDLYSEGRVWHLLASIGHLHLVITLLFRCEDAFIAFGVLGSGYVLGLSSRGQSGHRARGVRATSLMGQYSDLSGFSQRNSWKDKINVNAASYIILFFLNIFNNLHLNNKFRILADSMS